MLTGILCKIDYHRKMTQIFISEKLVKYIYMNKYNAATEEEERGGGEGGGRERGEKRKGKRKKKKMKKF